LGHLDYLNQTQYIKAEFTGMPTPTRKMFPAQLKREFDFRVITPWLIRWASASLDYKAAELTEKGRAGKMEANPRSHLRKGFSTKDMPFLEKVLIKSGLEDIFDARDVTEVIYRAMRDLMATSLSG